MSVHSRVLLFMQVTSLTSGHTDPDKSHKPGPFDLVIWRLKWPYAITKVTAYFVCGLKSDLVIYKFRKNMVTRDSRCPYWGQVSLNNTNPSHFSQSLENQSETKTTTNLALLYIIQSQMWGIWNWPMISPHYKKIKEKKLGLVTYCKNWSADSVKSKHAFLLFSPLLMNQSETEAK